MHDDLVLLRQYVEQHSEAAFAELVRRHLGLVYGIALRRVGHDAHLAEDVAQKVFADLARKAPALLRHASLSGWLFISAQVASAAVVRGETRRRARELAALPAMSSTPTDEPAADWNRLRPVIDDVIVGLKDDERTAVALRFFEQRTFAEIGAVLRVTEEAARKRVDRALDKLRAALARRGITSTTAALGLALTATTSTAVPSGLGARVAEHALARAAAAGSSVLATATGIVFPALAACVLGGYFVLAQRDTNRALRSDLARLNAIARAVAVQRSQNASLSRRTAEAASLRDMERELPALRAALVHAPAVPAPARAAALVVTPESTLHWNGEGVTLEEFVARLKALRAASPDIHSKIVLHAPGARFGAIAYVIDEVRKAGITGLVVESDAKPDQKTRTGWFN